MAPPDTYLRDMFSLSYPEIFITPAPDVKHDILWKIPYIYVVVAAI